MQSKEFRSSKLNATLFALLNITILLIGAAYVASTLYLWYGYSQNEGTTRSPLLMGITFSGCLAILAALLGFFRRSVACIVTYSVLLLILALSKIIVIVLSFNDKVNYESEFMKIFKNNLTFESRVDFAQHYKCIPTGTMCFQQFRDATWTVLLVLLIIEIILNLIGFVAGVLYTKNATKHRKATQAATYGTESRLQMVERGLHA